MNFIEEKILEEKREDKIVLRFPPNPNFSLHLGHCKSMVLNFGLAEKYNGICNLRFDDTNPSVEKLEYINSIIDDIKWLGYTPSNIFYASDYFEFIYNCAVILIKKGLAYVDDSTSEEMAFLKGTPTKPGIDSPFKKRTVDENLILFEKMKNGEFKEGEKTLRANIDMSSSNMILRDPVIYRIIEKDHHTTGNKWKIYPMYDFAHPLSDYSEGITDSLCTLEFEVHYPLYCWILNNCNLENPFPIEKEFSRLNLEYTVLSKRKLKELVEDDFVSGFDDPRMPTIAGMRNRGFSANSIKNFCEKIGVTRVDALSSVLLLEECLRDDLNKTSNRIMGVHNPLKLVITNWENGEEILSIENNPESENPTTRNVTFSKELFIERDDFKEEADNKFFRLKLGSEVRLKGAYVIKANEVIKENGEITEIRCTYDLASKSGNDIGRKIKGTIHWVNANDFVEVKVNEYSSLFNSKEPDSEENWKESINKESHKIYTCFFEKSYLDLNENEVFQSMRVGYFKKSDFSTCIKTVGLKSSYK